MRPVFSRLLVLPSLLLALALAHATQARADLVWAPETGWRIEAGALSGLSGNEARDALYLMNKGRRNEERKSHRLAAIAYEAVGKRFPNSIYAPEALYRAAISRQTRKEYSRAFENFQQIVLRYPNTRRFNEIIGEQYRIASALLDGARDRMLFGTVPGLKSPELAIEYFETILGNAPYSDYAPLALMNIARAHERSGDLLDAIDALDRMVNTYRRNLLTSDAYLRLAKAHAALVEGPEYDPTSARDAANYFFEFMVLYPTDPAGPEAEKGMQQMNLVLAESKMKMADYYFRRGEQVRNGMLDRGIDELTKDEATRRTQNYNAARVLYNDAITAYPDSEVAKRARTRLDEIAAKTGSNPASVIPGMPTAPAAQAEAPRKKRFWLF